jgi:NAD(P)-dependent dehydrogenase (short-subunit alcohol dehydrogenase family)
MTDDYRGATALVTGGASGIGAALARGLAARGAFVAIADRQIEAARAMATDLARIGAGASAHELDVRDQVATHALIAELWAARCGIDYVFANAGTGVGGEAVEYSDDDWRYIVDVNLMGVIHVFHAAYPRMTARRSGHLIATASMAGLLPSPMSTVYGATKHGVVGLCRSLRLEAGEYGVRVTALCPGVVRTALLVDAGVYGRVTRKLAPDVQLEEFEKFRPMDPDPFAGTVLARLPANPAIVIAPRWWKLVWWLDRLSPRLGDALTLRIYRHLRGKWSAGEVAPNQG